MSLHKANGYILHIAKHKDQDSFVHILTEQSGKLRLLAKGVKKITSKRSSSMDIFNKVGFGYYHKFPDMNTLADMNLLDDFEDLKADYMHLVSWFYLAEMLELLMPLEQEQPEIFDILEEFIDIARTNKDSWEFQFPSLLLKIIKTIGYEPDLNNCLICGKRLDQIDEINTGKQETLGYECHEHNPENTRLISLPAIKVQKFILVNSFTNTAKINYNRSICSELFHSADGWITTIIDRKLKSFGLMKFYG